MKTAVEWLYDLSKERELDRFDLEQAKQMEKWQIIEFCWECLEGDNIHTITSIKELIEYINNRYNQTYSQDSELPKEDKTFKQKSKWTKS
jgi:hypothetical protein